VWAAFHEQVVEKSSVDLVVDTNAEPIESVVATILAALNEGRAPRLR
jgi:hypothetical protein